MNSRTVRKYLIVILIILVAVLGYLCVLLAGQYRTIRTLPLSHSTLQLRHRGDRPLTAQNVTAIAPWMTFDFINRVFKLPSDYLEHAFHITDARYPNISLEAYARAQNIDSAVFLGQVQTEVGAYFDRGSSNQ